MATRRDGMDLWMDLEPGLMRRLMDRFVDTIPDCPEYMTIGQHLANILRQEANTLEGI